MVFDERDMKGIEDLISCAVPKSVCLRIRSVAYKGAGDGAGEDFGIISGDERKRATSDFP